MKNRILTILLGLSAGAGGSFIYNSFNQPVKETVYLANPIREHSTETHLTSANISHLNEEFAMASDVSTQCVVYIKTTIANQYTSNWFDFYFHGRGRGQNISSGSGVIFRKDGYIVTNNHVIEDATKIEVVQGKKTYEAKIIGTDPSTDLAVLKIEAHELPAIKAASSKELKIGEWVLAVGNPFNLNSTVTAGIVSAKARSINVVNSQFPIESFIQTDAAINPGNSGGALVNLRGELVGINTAILSKTGSYTGYGFAIPADIVVKVVTDIIQYGEVQKAFLGADITEINTTIAKKYDLKDLTGVILTYVQKGEAADKAGLQEGDVILKVNNSAIESKNNFDEILSSFSPGNKITVIYKRNGQIHETKVILLNREGTTEFLKREIFSSKSLGADFEKISKIEREKLRLDAGVKIIKVYGGLFQRLNIEAGFIITAINGEKISQPEQISNILESRRGRIVIEGINEHGSRGYYSYFY